MFISEILRRKGSSVVTIDPDGTVGDVVRLLAEHRIGAVVVVQDGRTTGIISERDVVRRLGEIGAGVLDLKARELMSSEVVTCAPKDNLDDIAQQITERRIRHLPVLSGDELVGIVTIGDVVAARMHELERTRVQLESYITQG